MSTTTRVSALIDFERDGKQSDYLRVPYSSDRSAYGWVPVPAICIRNGEGPTVLLTAGTHGDEYEGQVALIKLARELSHERICGRIIILPALNYPAVAAGRRLSPLDEGNLNRLFPGDLNGSPTQMIAHFVDSVLFPMCDVVVDLHSGGRSLDHLPVALARPGRSPEEGLKIKELLGAFGAGLSVISTGAGAGADTTLYSAAELRGIPAITTELGSGGTLSAEGLLMAEQGVKRILRHYGVAPDLEAVPGQPLRLMKFAGQRGAIYAMSDGLFEPWVACGEFVGAGQPAGLLHFHEEPLREPAPLTFEREGIVVCRRFPTLTARGDCLFVLIVDAD